MGFRGITKLPASYREFVTLWAFVTLALVGSSAAADLGFCNLVAVLVAPVTAAVDHLAMERAE